MAIHKPGRVLLTKIPLKFVRNKTVGGGRKATDAGIILIPFIDFLIVLVVFLLSTSGKEVVSTATGEQLTLPDASNVEDLEEAPVVAINKSVVLFETHRVADTATLAEEASLERIEQLVEELETQKRNWSILHPGKEFTGTIIVMSDKDVDYRVVKKVMYSAAQAGYANISFAVNNAGESS